MDILDLIKSKDIKDFYKKINFRFTTAQKLSILYNNLSLLSDIKRYKEVLYDTQLTDDLDGIKIYDTYLNNIQNAIDSFKILKENELFKFTVYNCRDIIDEEKYSSSYDELYKYGLSLSYETKFYIEKISTVLYRKSGYYDDYYIVFDEYGDIDVKSSFLIYNTPKELMKEYKYSIPFSNGDIVRVIDTNEIGIINTDIDKFYSEDNNDFVLLIEFYDKNNKTFYHDHISPFNIEFYHGEISELYKYIQVIIKENEKINFSSLSYFMNKI